MPIIKRALRFRPSLLLTFSVVSFVLITVLGVALAVGIQQKVEASALDQQVRHTEDLVNLYIAPSITSGDLQQPWDMSQPRYKELDRLIVSTLLRDHVVRVKLWGPQGQVLYSDQPQLIGQIFELEDDQLEALEGRPHSELTSLTAEENEFEREQYDRLLEVYVPLRVPGSDIPEAVLEIYNDLDAVDALQTEMSGFTWTLLGVGFFVLYASLFALVYRASRTLTQQNADNARLFLEASQRLAERVQAERSLRDRLEFERLVMAISSNFINLDTQDVDNGVRQALRALGSYTGVDRCYVLRFDETASGTAVAATHEWCERGVVPLAGPLGRVSTQSLPWLFSRLNEGEIVHIPSVAELPPAASAERDFFSALSARSVLLVPMAYNRTLVGALGMDRTRASAPWNEDGVALLRIAAEIFVSALERKRAQEAVRESNQRFRAVFESAATGIAVSDVNGHIVEVNHALEKLLGFTSDELTKMTFAHITHPEDLHLNIHYFRELREGKRSHYTMEKRYVRKNGEVVWVNLQVSALRDGEGIPRYAMAIVQDVTERRRAQQEIKRQLDRLNALRTIDNAITSSFDLPATLQVVLGQVTGQLAVHAASVLVLSGRTGTLEFSAGSGFEACASPSTLTPLRQRLASRAAVEGEMVRWQAAGQGAMPTPGLSELIEDEHFAAYFALPLTSRGKVVGVLEVFHRAPLDPAAEWLHFLETLAGQTAIAVDNAHLFQNLQRYNLELSLAYDTTLEGWSRALDLRDKETEGHTQRVTSMTVRLARAMGIDDEGLVHIRRGALLHDIGKMGIPDAILLKPGRLTEEEWEIMRLHPVYAHELLSPIPFLHPALDIPYCHHEKWDGTGYPRGLKGEEIPLAARIFAVVDVYDALRSDRPYRSAWPEEKVLQHIRSLAGTHFDPDVVDAFLRMDRAPFQRTPTTPELAAIR